MRGSVPWVTRRLARRLETFFVASTSSASFAMTGSVSSLAYFGSAS